ncbi:MAG: hypothetical protein ACK4TJ_14110 [Tabrizicola sp.]
MIGAPLAHPQRNRPPDGIRPSDARAKDRFSRIFCTSVCQTGLRIIASVSSGPRIAQPECTQAG